MEDLRVMKPTKKANAAQRQTKARILLVDDHPIMRQGLRELIDNEPDLVVCGECANGASALEAVDQQKPDLCIVDIALEGSNGIELLKNIKARYPDMLVLMLSMHDEGLYAERVLRAGARGYVMKQEATDKVLRAIRKVLGNEIYVSERLSTRMLHQFVGGKPLRDNSPLHRLSDRELEVFQLIGQGHGTRQIAKELHLSVKTIESYRAHLKAKLQLKNGNQLVQHAVQWVQSEAQAAPVLQSANQGA
jgi:DNA-binding NarL/FixJ family response regulator